MIVLDLDALQRAADALAGRPRAEMRAAGRVVGEVLLAQAESRVGAVSHQQIDARCGEAGATDATGEVDGIRPIEVLRRGPRSADEVAVVSALLARYLGEILDGEGGPARVRARLADLDWLEFTGPYAPYEAARVALAEDTGARFEALLAQSAVHAGSSRARAAVRALRGLDEPSLAPSSPERAGPARRAPVSIAVELAGDHRGFARRLLSSLALWGTLRGAVASVGGWVFSFKRPGTLSLEADALRLVGHTEVLGRTLRTWDIRWPVRELVELRREERFPAAPAALSILGLLVGVLVGARSVFEGVGATWFPLVAIGVGWLLAGVAFELVLRALWPGLTGRARLVVRARDARAIELTGLAADELDRLLDAVSSSLEGGASTVAASQRTPAPTARSREDAAPQSPPDDRTVEDPIPLPTEARKPSKPRREAR
jgi:hypothetical protein